MPRVWYLLHWTLPFESRCKPISLELICSLTLRTHEPDRTSGDRGLAARLKDDTARGC